MTRLDSDEYAAHFEKVQRAKDKVQKQRLSHHPVVFAKKKRERIKTRIAAVKTKVLTDEIKRRKEAARLANMTPNQREQEEKKKQARMERIQAACQHPNAVLVKSGKNIGSFFCPYCRKVVPPPTPEDEVVI